MVMPIVLEPIHISWEGKQQQMNFYSKERDPLLMQDLYLVQLLEKALYSSDH